MLLRTRVPELMDNPQLDPASHAEALHGLERLNIISSSADTLWDQLKRFSISNMPKPIKVLDVATGGGDILINLYKRAQNHNAPFKFTGTDISQTAIEYAKHHSQKANADISFIKLDAMNDSFPNHYDVIMTSLFTHHLDPDQVINLFKRMHDSSASLILVNDLVRSKLNLSLVWLATRIFSRSPIVQYDGPVSVKASYTVDEMKGLAKQAGLNNCQIKICPPCRQLLIWQRN